MKDDNLKSNQEGKISFKNLSYQIFKFALILITAPTFLAFAFSAYNASRTIFCAASSSKFILHSVWCKYIDWDFRPDIIFVGLTIITVWIVYALKFLLNAKISQILVHLAILIVAFIASRFLFAFLTHNLLVAN